MRKKFKKIGSNAIDPATTTGKTWGFRPVPNKGGATRNHDPGMKDPECKKIIFGGVKNA